MTHDNSNYAGPERRREAIISSRREHLTFALGSSFLTFMLVLIAGAYPVVSAFVSRDGMIRDIAARENGIEKELDADRAAILSLQAIPTTVSALQSHQVAIERDITALQSSQAATASGMVSLGISVGKIEGQIGGQVPSREHGR